MQKRLSILFLLFACVIYQNMVAQNYSALFDKYIVEDDTLKMGQLIREWEQVSPQDPELYTAKFNYYYIKSLSEEVVLSDTPRDESDYILKDSVGNIAGYMGSQIRLDKDYLNKCYAIIDEGISLYPDRLDMRFGKIYLLGEQENWGSFTEEVIKTIRRSGENNNNWKWTNNEDYSKDLDDFLMSIQNYQLALYHTGNDRLLGNMQQIANEILLLYPDNIMNLTNVAITYMIREEDDEAINLLKRANQIDPQDIIVYSNLARTYELKGDKENAILYYKKVEDSDDDEMRQYAKQDRKSVV